MAAITQTQRDTLFSEHDSNISLRLKQRIDKWKRSPPTSQFQQYGPLNKYLNEKFPNQIVKPQTLFRKCIDAEDEVLLNLYRNYKEEQMDDIQPAVIRRRVKKLLAKLENGNITEDSVHERHVENSKAPGKKHYPDFAVCEFGDEETKDRVHLVIEVATRPRNISNAALETLKFRTLRQLENYMVIVKETARFHPDKVIGMAMVGTEVQFLRAEYLSSNESGNEQGGYCWVSDVSLTQDWHSIYSKTFQDVMEEVAQF